MKRALLDLLVDPIELEPLGSSPDSGTEVDEGVLISVTGARYPILSGIPRFVQTEDAGQLQTSDAFAYKWQQRHAYDAPGMLAFSADWLVEKYGFGSQEEWARYYSSRRRILDVGCGSALSSSLFVDTEWWTGDAVWVGADISAAIDVAQDRIGHRPNTHFVQPDALQLPFPDASFNTIFSEGVLDPIPSARRAILSVVRELAPSGDFHFYAYRREGPVREFTAELRQSCTDARLENVWLHEQESSYTVRATGR